MSVQQEILFPNEIDQAEQERHVDGASGRPLDRLLASVLPDNRLTLTVEETAKVLGIGRSAAYDAVNRGDIPSRRVNGRILVPVPALMTWLGVDCRTPEAG